MLGKLGGRYVATSKEEATRVVAFRLLPAPEAAWSSTLHKIACCGGGKGRVLRQNLHHFKWEDLAKNPGGTTWAPTAGGVMKDPDLSKAALIAAGQTLQEVRQQVLQNFNFVFEHFGFFGWKAVHMDPTIEWSLLMSGRTVEPRTVIKPSIDKTWTATCS